MQKDLLQEHVIAVMWFISAATYHISVDPSDKLDFQEEFELKEQEVYSMCVAGANPLKVTVCANDVDLTMEVDSGASVSVITKATYYCVWPDHCRPPLIPSNAVLRCYSGLLKVSGRIEQYRAGVAGTAGTVLAVPLFGRLTISRRGLYSPGEWHPHGVNVVHACSSKRPVAHVSCWNFLIT